MFKAGSEGQERCQATAMMICLSSILLQQSATAQQNSPRERRPPAMITERGGPVFSTPADPFMTHGQELELLNLLRKEDDANWGGFSARELERYLSAQMRVSVNYVELEFLGLDSDAPLVPDNGTYLDLPAGPLGDRLQLLLEPNELTFLIQANRLTITSRDAADSAPVARVYDVTPLILRRYQGSRLYKYDNLVNVLQQTIYPDNWYASGGTSSMVHYTAGEPGNERGLLTVACPSPTHLKIQSLLNRLNGFLGEQSDRPKASERSQGMAASAEAESSLEWNQAPASQSFGNGGFF